MHELKHRQDSTDSFNEREREPATDSAVQPVNVCYLIDNLGVGGTEKHLLRLIRDLDRTRFRPILVLLDGEKEDSMGLEPADCPVFRLGIRMFKRPKAVVEIVRFARFLKRNKVHVLQMYFPDSTCFGSLAGRLAKVPLIIRTRRNIGHWMTKKDYRMGRIVSRCVHITIANSEACRLSVIETDRAHPDTVMVIPNDVDTGQFAWIPPVDIDPDMPRIGIVANLRPVKNLEVFVKAAATVARRFPNARFSIAGEGQCRPDLERLSNSLGLADRLRFEGQIDDIPNYLAGIDIAILCSDCEGSSNSLAEYMAAGRAIVVSDIAANREVISHGKTGLLFRVGDPDDLAAKIEQLLADRDLSRKLAVSARKIGLGRYARKQGAAQYAAIYQSFAERALT